MSSGSHLSVVLDLSPIQWHLSAQPPPANPYALSLATFLSQLLAFLNAHIASQHENSLAVFAALPGKSLMLYASTDAHTDQLDIDPNSFPPFKLVDSTVVQRIMDEIDALGDPDEELPCALVGAFTKALCYVNRISIPPPNAATSASTTPTPTILPEPRILILSVSPDLSESYIPIMNSIFSAQKLKVTVDVCQIYGPDSVFLQQAAHLTGGSYIYLERRDALLQYLIMAFLPPPAIRKILAVPTQDRVDFRAACFCHKNIVDIGFTVFCQPVPVCSTCRTKFPIKTLQRLNASRPSAPSNRPSPGTRAPSAALARNPSVGSTELLHSGITEAIGNGRGRTPNPNPTTNGSKH